MKQFFLRFFLCLLSGLLVQGLAAQRAMYVDGFDVILNSNASKTALLQYAQSHQITYLILYDLHLVHNQHDLTSASSNQILADFIHDAKTNYSISKMAAAGENAWFFQNRIMAYNATRTLASEKFDVLGMEFEFWTTAFIQSGGYYCVNYLQPNGLACDSAGAFIFCKDQLTQMKAMTTVSTHPMTVEMYVGWPNAGQLKAIADIVDKTLIHAYVSNPSTAFSYALSRLQHYNSYSSIENISIIFSAEPAFMGSWLASNSMLSAEQTFMNQYNSATGAWKSHLNMEGFTYFTYSMMTNVPLPIEVLDFQVYMVENKPKLFWEIHPQDALYGFEIERSGDGQHFETADVVPFISHQSQYHFTDELFFLSNANPLFYRIKIIENDGQITYSPVLEVAFNPVNMLRVYPNPVSNQLNIISSYPSATLKVYNSYGQEIVSKEEIPQFLDVKEWNSGIYWLKVGGIVTKFVKE